MIEGFDHSSLVIVNLVNPKEKFFGVLRSLSAAGCTSTSESIVTTQETPAPYNPRGISISWRLPVV